MSEEALKIEMSNILIQEIGKPFFKAWLGCVNDRGAICYRARVQALKTCPTYTGFRMSISSSRRMGEIVNAVCDEKQRAQSTPCNAVTFILERDGKTRCDYGFRDVVKTGWASIFDQWDRDYLSGLKFESGKGKPWES